MTTHLMAKSRVALAAIAVLAGALTAQGAWAQNFPISAAQKQTANEVAQKGVPLSELAPNAPDSYTIKSGDTLWDISKLFLKSPWRWPELWGMNLNDIKNPHRIYPGQVLLLERLGDKATLRVAGSGGDGAAPETIRVTPRTRYESLADLALPALKSRIIEAFLAEPLVVDSAELQAAPRIVATQEDRVLLTRGDRAYARSSNGSPLMDDQARQQSFRLFRNATPLKDPGTGEVLGYEAQYIGKAQLIRSETTGEVLGAKGQPESAVIPATIDIVSAKEEIRVGDRMLPEPARDLSTYTPRAPTQTVEARVVSVYGSAVINAGQNQVVAINQGARDGMLAGHVLAILKDGQRIVDKTDATRPLMKLPNERNGLLMVFRTFDRVSYALILETTDSVRVGDRLVNPR
ncbi:MAG: LysM peptidoglycan-binding domain-containing protein [Curvibacter sp.]|nr:MAG: LysM peptidoglycan-binding domain-containing protein [Curvibacter sp.]